MTTTTNPYTDPADFRAFKASVRQEALAYLRATYDPSRRGEVIQVTLPPSAVEALQAELPGWDGHSAVLM